MQAEFDPISSFNNLARSWWKILVLAVLGGLLGLGFTFFQQPAYQAEATFHASIDFTEINFENLVGEYGHPVVFTQYDEDLALQVVERSLKATMGEALEYAWMLDPGISSAEFRENSQIRRYMARWHLRYRHPDPLVAQSIVNFWAEIGLEELARAQETGRAESFVMIDLVSLADLPQRPLYHQRNNLVLAGSMTGFLVGLLVVDIRMRLIKNQNKGD